MQCNDSYYSFIIFWFMAYSTHILSSHAYIVCCVYQISKYLKSIDIFAFYACRCLQATGWQWSLHAAAQRGKVNAVILIAQAAPECIQETVLFWNGIAVLFFQRVHTDGGMLARAFPESGGIRINPAVIFRPDRFKLKCVALWHSEEFTYS